MPQFVFFFNDSLNSHDSTRREASNTGTAFINARHPLRCYSFYFPYILFPQGHYTCKVRYIFQEDTKFESKFQCYSIFPVYFGLHAKNMCLLLSLFKIKICNDNNNNQCLEFCDFKIPMKIHYTWYLIFCFPLKIDVRGQNTSPEPASRGSKSRGSLSGQPTDTRFTWSNQHKRCCEAGDWLVLLRVFYASSSVRGLSVSGCAYQRYQVFFFRTIRWPSLAAIREHRNCKGHLYPWKQSVFSLVATRTVKRTCRLGGTHVWMEPSLLMKKPKHVNFLTYMYM